MFQLPRGTFLPYNKSRASVLVIMCTSEPHMSAIFHIVRYLSSKNTQKEE